MKLCLGKDHCSQTTRPHESAEPVGLKKSYAWARKVPTPLDQSLIRMMLASDSPHCRDMRSLIEMIAFHSGEEEWCAWTVQMVLLLK